MRVSLFAVVGVLLSGMVLANLTATARAQDAVVHEGSNADPNPGEVGEKPYEMVGRQETRRPLVTFEDCTQWVIEGHSTEAFLYRTQDRRLYRDHCGKLVYRATGPRPSVLVRLKQPVKIPDPWDCVNFWNWGNNWAWAPQKHTPPLRVAIIVQGADGKQHALDMGSMNYQYWFLMHAKLHDAVARPAKFIGVRFTNGTNTDDRAVYLGPISFYQEPLQPLTFDPWPEELPFPTRSETILPSNKTERFTNAVRHTREETIFTYDGDDGKLRFRYRPVTGTLSDLAVLYNSKEIYPCKGGGLQIAGLPPDSVEIKAELREQTFQADVLTLRWRLATKDAATEVSYRIRIKQKSLVIEMEEHAAADEDLAGAVEQVLLGHAEPVGDAKLFWIPYLTFGSKSADPRVLYADGLFFFTQFDWYSSDASALFGGHWIRGNTASHNGGARYTPKTDGRRNPMRERLFINVSPDFHEVLPTIPNPPSPMKSVQGDRLWRVKHGGDHEAEIREARHLRSLGLEKVTIRYHENSWRDAGESFTFRLDAAPKRGGDEALRRFVAAVQACDWRVGLYTNYTDFAPVNKHWNEDWVSRAPNGDWMKAWARCYAPKPLIAMQMEAKLAPGIQKEFAENHSYCDVHTCVTPFSRVDYDARVPGAGTFRRTFECFGRLLYNEKSAHNGPVYSEGRNHWWYAGLADGNYAQLASPDPPTQPLLVDFDLLKIHPLEMDAGMGSPSMFQRRSDLLTHQQFIATTLAYGHIGFLGANEPDIMKIYYMLQPLEEHYTMVPVRRIAYEHEGRLLDTSEALVTGAYSDSRVHVEYESGLKVWVNGSGRQWEMDAAGRWWALPQWGYLATTQDGATFSYSGLAQAGGLAKRVGPRTTIDLSHGPSSHYLDTHGSFVFADTMAGQGAAALKKEKTGWELIPARQFSEFGFSPELIGAASGNVQVQVVDEQGASCPQPTIRWSRGLLYLIPGGAKAFKYRLSPRVGKPPEPIECATRLGVRGEAIQAVLPVAATVDAKAVRWQIQEVELDAGAEIEGRTLTAKMPTSAPPGQHAWLRIPTTDGLLWLDFITAAPYEITIAPAAAHVKQGQAVPLHVTLSSNLKRPAAPRVRIDTSVGEVETPEAAVKVPAQGQTVFTTHVALPWQRAEVQLTVTAGELEAKVVAKRKLSARIEHALVTDLTSASVGWEKSYCRRGGQEVMGGKTMYEGSFYVRTSSSGDVNKKAIFSHPPFGPSGPGYVFALATITLPKEPALIGWHMGMNDGTDPTDGVTYRVVVIDEQGKAHQVFERHYDQVKWSPAEADLSAFAGRRLTLGLIADCGPDDDTTADHANWGEPRIVAKQPGMLLED